MLDADMYKATVAVETARKAGTCDARQIRQYLINYIS
jgi:hypothetical protein